MYGQIHCIVRELVLQQVGEQAWQDILDHSGLDVHQHFLVFTQYPDSLTLQLLGAVSHILDLPSDDVCRMFGNHFLTYCLRHGYDKMLQTLGGDFVSFMQNLDSLHSLLSLSYKCITAPSFRVEENGQEGDLLLHYYSQRKGLHPIVMGLVEAVGRVLFEQTATLTIVGQTQETVGSTVQHHTVFRVELERRGVCTGRTTALAADSPCVDPATSTANLPVIQSPDLCQVFPYHIVFDNDLCIVQCGRNIRRMTRTAITPGLPFTTIGTILQPPMAPTMDNVFKFINAVFLLAIHRKADDSSRPFLLRGQMAWLKNTQLTMFVGSPRLTSLNELIDMKMYLADIPIYDCTRELVLLNQQRIAEIDVAKELDETTSKLQKMSVALEEEKQRTEELLLMMLPEKVAVALMQGISVKAEKFNLVTILFSDIVTFTNIAAACTPYDVIHMLNELYNTFDSLTDSHDVYKVETVGDAYMCVCGAPEVQDDHAERIANFAMDMIERSCKVNSPATGLPLQIRVGLHSGPVVAGVVGKKMPRYCLFGDTVNTTSRMESHGIPGRVHVSEITQTKLYQYGYVFRQRGEIEVKGKGRMRTFFLIGHFQRRIMEPEDEFRQVVETSHPKPTHRVYLPAVKVKGTKSFQFFRRSSSAEQLLLERRASSRAPAHSAQDGGGTNVDTGEASGQRPTLCRTVTNLLPCAVL